VSGILETKRCPWPVPRPSSPQRPPPALTHQNHSKQFQGPPSCLFVCACPVSILSQAPFCAPSSSGSRMALKPGLVTRSPLQPGPVPPTAAPAAASLADSAQPSKAVVLPAPAAASLAAQPQTTLMLRNLGADVTTQILLEQLRLFGMEGRVDFVHAWVDFKTHACTGVAYVNFFDPADARVLKAMWHGREEMGGIPCHPHRVLNVVFARKQGFDCCLIEAIRPHFKDPSMMAWIHPSKLSPPGFWHPPGLAASPEADGRDRAHDPEADGRDSEADGRDRARDPEADGQQRPSTRP